MYLSVNIIINIVVSMPTRPTNPTPTPPKKLDIVANAMIIEKNDKYKIKDVLRF